MKKKSDILVAMPSLKDSIFTESIILLKEEEEDDGNFGVIINRQTDINLKKLLKLFQIKFYSDLPKNVLIGGPVDLDFIWVLHNEYYNTDASEYISENVYLSPLRKLLKIFLSINNANSRLYQIGIGYSSWTKGQLVRELEQGSWWRMKASVKDILETELPKRWMEIFATMGVDSRMLSDSEPNLVN